VPRSIAADPKKANLVDEETLTMKYHRSVQCSEFSWYDPTCTEPLSYETSFN